MLEDLDDEGIGAMMEDGTTSKVPSVLSGRK
jgi:hypothetical protein